MFRKLRRSTALYRQLVRAARTREAILIYQMGKVGSEALEVSLREADPVPPAGAVEHVPIAVVSGLPAALQRIEAGDFVRG